MPTTDVLLAAPSCTARNLASPVVLLYADSVQVVRVQRVLKQRLAVTDLGDRLVGTGQEDRRCDARIKCFLPARCAQAPAITGP